MWTEPQAKKKKKKKKKKNGSLQHIAEDVLSIDGSNDSTQLYIFDLFSFFLLTKIFQNITIRIAILQG